MEAQVISIDTRLRIKAQRKPQLTYQVALRNYTSAFTAMVDRCVEVFNARQNGKTASVASALTALDNFHAAGPVLDTTTQRRDGEAVITRQLVGINRKLVFLRANIERFAFAGREPKLLEDTEKLLCELGNGVELVAGGCLTVMPA